ncbi:nuclear transport factor 2 family protein [Pedobacter sp. SD-b]|uniref:Nuclear transport factor 2 family protein n=1 Tax=Pedobacter segetis TaxID=2793069 RepID=A0ABS1BGL2_9SPHI|nr:nuclear transport factor 2 family protein [Pedobacter segetis]MBK0382010.1 nuclear transport factor 2 family protein [Pedobacter segetis]
MKKIFLIGAMLLFLLGAKAQKNDGTVSSLIKTENYFNEEVAKEGISEAFLKMTGKNGVVFRPNPVNIKQYYNQNPSKATNLSWQPEFAMISKDGELGFTTGLYTLNNEQPSFGHYLSIWRSNQQKKWELALDAGIAHDKPIADAKQVFLDPSDYKYPKLIGPKKMKMREDIVFSTDLLLSKALNQTGNKNFKDFYADEVRYYFPGKLPIIGKANAVNFIYGMGKQVTSYPNFVDRAFSGDLAYTNGKATIGQKKYNYIRIWQKDAQSKWNIILDMYLEAE